MLNHASRTTPSDSAQSARLERGFERQESWAFESAYRLFGPRCYAIAVRLLHEAPAAQDCVHDVLLRLWKRPGAYSRDRGALEAFLAVCTRNEALARLRRDARRSEIARGLPVDISYDVDIDPIQSARLARAKERLHEGHRQLIELAYDRSMTQREIAARLDVPLGTVKTRMSAALRALRAALGDAQ